jgi:hypothetical protein
VCWRELRDLPGSLTEAYRNRPQGEISMKTLDYSHWFGDPDLPPEVVKPCPWREVLLVIGFFVIYIFMTCSYLLSDLFFTKEKAIFLAELTIRASFVFLFIFVIWGSIKRFPDWSLPAAGFSISLISFLGLNMIPKLNQSLLLILCILTFLPFVVAFLSRWIKPIRHLWQNISHDPTRLTLIYLGLICLVSLFMFPQPHFERKQLTTTIAIFIPTAVLFLRSNRLWQRFIIPIIGFLIFWGKNIFGIIDLINQPLRVSWEMGLDRLLPLGLLILMWFLLPGLWILARRLK